MFQKIWLEFGWSLNEMLTQDLL